MCISCEIKCLILLMHGATMKFSSFTLLCSFSYWNKQVCIVNRKSLAICRLSPSNCFWCPPVVIVFLSLPFNSPLPLLLGISNCIFCNLKNVFRSFKKTVNFHVEMLPEVIGSAEFIDCRYPVIAACWFAQFVRMGNVEKEIVMHLWHVYDIMPVHVI